MNGPVPPAASPARPGRRPDVRGRLGEVALAPVRSLGFFGLALAGAALLAVVVVPAVFGVWALAQIADDVAGQRYALSRNGGQPGQALPNLLMRRFRHSKEVSATTTSST